MKRTALIIFILLLSASSSIALADERVSFKGHWSTDSFMLTGILTKPEGQGPFPAIVMLHGVGGMEGTAKQYYEKWAERIAGWGYASLRVNSFGPRGETDITDKWEVRMHVIGPPARAQDALDGKAFLNTLPFVKRNQIALMGWSHGGWSIFRAIDDLIFMDNRGEPFRAAIAFYPYCDVSMQSFNAPLLILGGELDEWTPAAYCRSKMPAKKPTHETILKIYPDATHCFDFEGIDKTKKGHRLLYNKAAAEDANKLVRGFLLKHLN